MMKHSITILGQNVSVSLDKT